MKFYCKLFITMIILQALFYSSQLLMQNETTLGKSIIVFINSPILIGAGFIIGLIWNSEAINEKFGAHRKKGEKRHG